MIGAIREKVSVLLVDGYCHLSADFQPGLGAYLHEALTEPAQIVGVAKNRFRHSQHAIEVFRGNSMRPLFVTAIDISYESASRHIQTMSGDFRIPKMLKWVDHLARDSANSTGESQSLNPERSDGQ